MVRSHSKRHHKQKKSADWRLRLIAAIFLLLFTSILGVLLELQVIHHATLSVQAEEQRIVQRVIPARRGDILASDGLPLAQNVTLNLIYAVPWMVEEPAAAALQLSPLLNIPVDELHEKLSRQSSYVPLKHWVEETEAEAVRQLKLKGIVITGEEKRYYPEGRMLSHVLGFTNSEGIGQYGLEKYYDPLLKGKEGYLRREQDTSGRSIPIGLNEEIPPVDGVHIVLTIDRSVQRIVEAKLKKGVERVSAEQGSVIVMDPLTGAVLAMANYPDFDPNNYVESLKDAEGNIQEHAYAVFNNDAVSWPYEPGSVFKVITMAAALDSGKVKVDATFFDSGSLGVGGLTIVNWDRLGHGELSLSRCLEISNNVCLAQVALATEGSNFYRYIQGFGFGSTTGIDLPYELGGTIQEYKNWNEIQTAYSGFGQAISVTPVQLITGVSAIANRGRMVRPYIVQEQLSGEQVIESQPQVIKQVISKEVAEELTRMMVNVVDRSEGRPGKVAGYEIAGKTGTAQVAKKGESGYEEEIFNVSFVGFAPADAPKFIILVKLKLTPQTHPDLRWGSQAAAPVFREIAEELFKYYEMPPMGV